MRCLLLVLGARRAGYGGQVRVTYLGWITGRLAQTGWLRRT